MGIYEVLEELRKDTTHGATWYLKRGIEAIEEALRLNYGDDELRRLIKELEDVRPGMATLKNLAEAINTALERGLDIENVVGRIKSYQEDAERRLEEVLRRFVVKCGSAVMTISYSSAVGKAIRQWAPCIGEIYLLESRPGNEAREALREYSGYAKVSVIPDSALAYYLREAGVDYVIVGADGVYIEGYFLNKVGTLTLAIASNELKRKFIVVFESYKACKGDSMSIYRVDYQYEDTTTKVPLFDKVPLDYVDYAITDLRIIKNPTEKDIEKVREEFLKAVLTE